MHIKDAYHITKPLNAETILSNRPLSVQGLCEGCCDADPEPDDVLCAECAADDAKEQQK